MEWFYDILLVMTGIVFAIHGLSIMDNFDKQARILVVACVCMYILGSVLVLCHLLGILPPS